MSNTKHKRKSGRQKDSLPSTLNLIAAILNLLAVILVVIEKLVE